MFRNKDSMIVYDFENDEWSEKACEATKNLSSFSCVRTPIISKSIIDQNPPDINEPAFEIHPIFKKYFLYILICFIGFLYIFYNFHLFFH